MKLPFLKKSPSDVAGIMFGHMVGFIDGFRLPGVGKNPISLAETYILGEWIQTASVVVAAGGGTDRAIEIIKSYGETQFSRMIQFLFQGGYLKVEDLTPFASYVTERSPRRREEYDIALARNGHLADVASVAVPYLCTESLSAGEATEAAKALRHMLESLAELCVGRFKEVV